MKRGTKPPHLADPFVLAHQAREFLGDIDAKTQEEWVKRGILPLPLKITQRTIGWRLSTLQAVLERAEQKAVQHDEA